ncbi:hypothetical protein GUJ93_ZPchr0010g7892 [Zizania palustris]|uniref:Uncharacterized protein n=1 Tax=Zizania palustris TaxID=103762 RepID=A0A8J6BI61_ZIZPA|nr:hypothetical protein GUJ93_ZPchr0010g7892 [Zizania palustris]
MATEGLVPITRAYLARYTTSTRCLRYRRPSPTSPPASAASPGASPPSRPSRQVRRFLRLPPDLARYPARFSASPLISRRGRFWPSGVAAVRIWFMTYMPQDFRGTLIRQQRERSERNKQAEVDALVSAGGGIRDRYGLLWKQQMERRMQLAQLGSATGVYKTLVRYLVGVPQVLLDFIRQINDDNGEVFVNAPFFISLRMPVLSQGTMMNTKKLLFQQERHMRLF